MREVLMFSINMYGGTLMFSINMYEGDINVLYKHVNREH